MRTLFEYSVRIEIDEPAEIDERLAARMSELIWRTMDREIERLIFGGAPPPAPRGTITIDTVRPKPAPLFGGVISMVTT